MARRRATVIHGSLRWRALLARLSLGLAPLLVGCAEDDAVAAPTPVDPRLAPLLVDCGADGARLYDRNVSEFVEILVRKLEEGEMDVLRRTREELGRLGETAVPALARVVDRHYASAIHAPRVENALAALGLNPAPGARDVLLRGLDHPKETIQQTALAGLRIHHVAPEDFDRFLAHLASPISPNARRAFTQALFDADAPRARRLAAEWVAAGANRGLWQDVVPRLAAAKDPEVAATCLAHAVDAPPHFAPYLVAAAAALELEDAPARLRADLEDADQVRRTSAVEAAAAAGLAGSFVELFDAEPDVELRILMLGHLDAAGLEGPRIDALLLAAMDDPNAQVRAFATKVAVVRGLPAATARALAFLERDAKALQIAFDAFRSRFDAAPDEAEIAAVRDALLARFEREAHLPIGERAGLLKGIGVCPGAASARALRAIGLAHAEQEIEGLGAHRWAMIQAANTGPAGLDALAVELAGEVDPTRRIDLLQALTSTRDEGARERLLAIAEDPRVSGAEKLLVAHALVHLGHGAETAGRLKRVLYAFDDDDPARRPLQCLLWRWY